MAVGLVILVIEKKSRCCITCYSFRDRRRCNKGSGNRNKSRKPRLKPPRIEVPDLEAGLAPNFDPQSQDDPSESSGERFLPARHGHSSSALMTESRTKMDQNDKYKLLPALPAMAHLKEDGVLRDD